MAEAVELQDVTMDREKVAKWRRSARHLRYEIIGAIRFRCYQAALYWAMNKHRKLSAEDGGPMVQSIIGVYEEYKALLIRRVTKQSESAGGVSLLGLLKDITAWPAIAAGITPELPPHAEVLSDLQRLEAAVRPVNDVADRIYAHVDPRPPGPIWEAVAGRDEALDLTIKIGAKYASILDEPLPDDVYCAPTEFSIRELFGAAWITDGDEIPDFRGIESTA